jgi:hypothetical protein
MKRSLFAIALLALACSMFLLNGCTSSTDTTTTTSTSTTASTASSSTTTTTAGGSATWQAVGALGFAGTTETTDVVIGTNSVGSPYVAFSNTDYSTNPMPMVMKHTSGNWNYVGAKGFGLTDGYLYTFRTLSFMMYGDTPYIAFRGGTGPSIEATYFDGSNWVNTGLVMATDALYPAIFADSSGTYCVYQNAAFPYQANCKTYSSGWSSLGAADFSDGDSRYFSLSVYSGVPYLAFVDYANSGISVMKYQGGNWTYVGGKAGVSTSTTAWPSLFVDQSSGTPYVAYLDGGKVYVKQFSGSSWSQVGSGAVSVASAGYPSLYVASGTPYVAFKDSNAGDKATVMQYTSGTWSVVGIAGFSDDAMAGGSERTLSLTVSPQGIPYVAVIRGEAAQVSRLSVYKYQ